MGGTCLIGRTHWIGVNVGEVGHFDRWDMMGMWDMLYKVR